MSVEEIYCLYNRARGINLISPDDLYRACLLFEKSVLEFKEFENGVKIVLLRGEEGNLSKKILEIIANKGCQSSFDISKELNIPVTFACNSFFLISNFIFKFFKKLSSDRVTFG